MKTTKEYTIISNVKGVEYPANITIYGEDVLNSMLKHAGKTKSEIENECKIRIVEKHERTTIKTS